jgi:hypothetical protein
MDFKIKGSSVMSKVYYCDECKEIIKPGGTYMVLDVKFYKKEETPEAKMILQKAEHLFCMACAPTGALELKSKTA